MATYHFSSYRFSDNGILWQGDRLVALTPLQRRMLGCFCRNPRDLLSKAMLMEQVWGHEDVSEMSLARSVHGLRRKLGTARQGAELIRNVYGEGYIFTPAVEVVEESASAAVLAVAGLAS
ncbi:MAG: winged helix-turn-helix domain-containing protein [Prochlorococcaceae cyanobacterium]